MDQLSINGDTFVFQQEGKTNLRAALVRPWHFCPTRHRASLWPPNSPDLNPVDYKVWGVIVIEYGRVYCTPILDVADLIAGACHGRGSGPVAWSTARLSETLRTDSRHYEVSNSCFDKYEQSFSVLLLTLLDI